jgi:hypothetical protein
MFISTKVRFCTGFGFHFYCIGCHESLGYLIINVTDRYRICLTMVYGSGLGFVSLDSQCINRSQI